jgi:hypothetical protein
VGTSHRSPIVFDSVGAAPMLALLLGRMGHELRVASHSENAIAVGAFMLALNKTCGDGSVAGTVVVSSEVSDQAHTQAIFMVIRSNFFRGVHLKHAQASSMLVQGKAEERMGSWATPPEQCIHYRGDREVGAFFSSTVAPHARSQFIASTHQAIRDARMNRTGRGRRTRAIAKGHLATGTAWCL